MIRGRPFQPGNQFGRGRPKGSPNKKQPRAQQLFEDHAAAILALAIHRCREDPHMLRMLASRIVPRRRDAPVKLGRLPLHSLQDLDRASEATLQRAAAGKISLNEALEVSALIENRRGAK
jgi:hypothetical protein